MKRAGGIGTSTPEEASKAKGNVKASNSASNSVNVTGELIAHYCATK